MKDKIWKYAIILMIFFMGLSIGGGKNTELNDKNNVEYGVYIGADKIDENVFIKIAKNGEKLTTGLFNVLFNSLEEIFKKILGI